MQVAAASSLAQLDASLKCHTFVNADWLYVRVRLRKNGRRKKVFCPAQIMRAVKNARAAHVRNEWLRRDSKRLAGD